ncbi:MAG: alkaline phosphatase, partial [Burkholderiales bacterium]
MTLSASLSRRRALQIVAVAPVLPLASSLAAWPFCAEATGRSGATYEFNAMPAPSLLDPAQMATTYVNSSLSEKGPHKTRTYQLGYETFFRTGQRVPDTAGGTILAGGYRDIRNQPIIDRTDPGRRQFFSDCPDGMSLITLPGAKSKLRDCERVFAVVQFEYTTRNVAGASMYGLLPSPIAVLTLDQERRTGKLTLVSYSNVDTRRAHGLWITCGASLSPWNTHLSS